MEKQGIHFFCPHAVEMQRSPAHPELSSLTSSQARQLSVSRSATLLRAMLNSPPTPITGAPTLPQALPVVVPIAYGVPCKERGHYPGTVSGDGKWQRR